ncbi:DUF397 domain-containing protein [Streptomyces boluensis]|uniref:DUF397 domain-containing protein n=1 Tax=Streptomyces boluensis TaxID=1775135 RepID=A0A964UVE5_9ACTN|nr:DUF397 domain-containing protein [Streptomyces boluensis]NBE55437.1 DUF397 domain-containing protein [Streptomyces boluensis]
MASNRKDLGVIRRKFIYAKAFPGAAHWRKSSYSNGDGGLCLEVRDGLPGLVPVRDSKNAEGPVLVFPAAAWGAFMHGLRGPELP